MQRKEKNIASILVLFTLGLTLLFTSMPISHAFPDGGDILSGLGCDDDNKDGLNVLDCVSGGGDEGPVISFIDFKGDFKAPNAEGYTEGLTQATDARTFILNVTNFILGFLGLIAVLIVIYGGVTMVVSMGNPEGAGKGKKAIGYAAVGLLIVMGSFAIVNTIILAPSGSERGNTSQTLNSNSIRGVSGEARFNYLVDIIDNVILDVYNSYQFHLETKQKIYEVYRNIGAWNPSTCYVPMDSCLNSYKTLVNTQLTTLTNIANSGSANAAMSLGMRNFVTNVWDKDVGIGGEYQKYMDRVKDLECHEDNTFLGGDECDDDDINELRKKFGTLRNSTTKLFEQAFTGNDTNFLHKSYQEDMQSAANNLGKIKDLVSGITGADGATSEGIGKKYFDILIGPHQVGASSSTSPGFFVNLNGTLFDEEVNNMAPFFSIMTSLDSTLKQEKIRSILQNLLELKAVLENVEFVNAVLSVDTIEGNAPFLVNFSSVGSSDPSGLTITSGRIKWDLNGDGNFTANEVTGDHGELESCNEGSGTITSCIFKEAGTYRVTLKVLPSDAINPITGDNFNQEIAPGISYVDIRVNPPATKINLSVGPQGSEPRPVILYDENTGELMEDHDKVYFTLAEAKNGINFDATKTKYQSDTQIINDPTAKVRWNFGTPSQNNDTIAIPSEDTLHLTQVYPEMGNYQVRFEVTDRNGVTDRKIFTVVVSNLAPRLTNPPTSGKIGQELIFDGSNSTTDGSPISFGWRVEQLIDNSLEASLPFSWINRAFAAPSVGQKNLSSPNISIPQAPSFSFTPATASRVEENEFYRCEMPVDKDDQLACIFKKAGMYRVTLSLDDEGIPIEQSTTVTITSNQPTAAFDYDRINEQAPALYKLNAARLSFDPDETDNDLLEYSWEISPDNCVLIGFADQNTNSDLLKTSTDAYSSQTSCKQLQDWSTNTSQPVIKFTKKDTYTVNLAVRMANEKKLESIPTEKSILVNNVLDLAWGDMKPSAILEVQGGGSGEDQLPDEVNVNAVAPIEFLFISSQAISYELDFGDGDMDAGEMTPGVLKKVVHNYAKTGKYKAALVVYDADDVDNSITRNVFIGDSESPIAIISTKVNGSEVEPTSTSILGGHAENVIVVNRQDNLTFSAEKSVNTDGTGRRLKYSWNVNNGEKQSASQQIAYNFKNLSDGGEPYTVDLKVTNDRDVSQTAADQIQILVVGEQPTARSLTAVTNADELTTPVTVKLNAVGAEDPDGQIVQYKWWYYDASRPATRDERIGVQVTTAPTASLTIGTRGLEGEKPKYKFGMEITDNDNLTVSTDSENENTKLNIPTPEIQVENGPNKAPVARFTVDRTSIEIGESVNFTSSSIDPDEGGKITEYKWDFGDGTKGENLASVSHVYQKANVDGYKAKLTVTDNNSSEATSDSIRIYVDAKANPPEAAFTNAQTKDGKTVKFKNNSTADEAAGAKIVKYTWDFNVNEDSNGDGKKDNDIDSGEKDPSNTYKDYGVYRAKLTVEDNQGQQASITNFINVKPAQISWTGNDGSENNVIGSDITNNDLQASILAANFFEAGHTVDIGLVSFGMISYGYLLFNSKNKKNK